MQEEVMFLRRGSRGVVLGVPLHSSVYCEPQSDGTIVCSLRNSTNIQQGRGRAKKFPAIKHNYESMSTPGLFFAGATSHSLDFRKSAGGFIHGFRYTGG